MDEKTKEIYNRASMAEGAKGYFDAVLLDKKDLIISTLCSMYREGKLDFPVICGKLGELTLIEDVTKRVNREIKKGREIESHLEQP